MTQSEWLASRNPAAMLAIVAAHTSSRKLRLAACACCRLIWSLMVKEQCQYAVIAAEQFAEGMIGYDLMKEICQKAIAIQFHEIRHRSMSDEHRHAVRMSVNSCNEHGISALYSIVHGYKKTMHTRRPAQADVLRCIIPFRAHEIQPQCLTSNVLACTNAAHDTIDGTLDPIRLSILADALEDADCRDYDLLSHLRLDLPHFRGCWAIDTIRMGVV